MVPSRGHIRVDPTESGRRHRQRSWSRRGAAVRVVLTHPYCWPYVRRGSERFIAEFARYLTGRGHDVLTISSRPGRGTRETTPDAGQRWLHRQVWTPLLGRCRVQPAHTFGAGCLASLLRAEADVVQSLYPIDGYAAKLARRLRGFQTVFHVTGPFVPKHLPRVPPDRWIVRSVLRSADQVLCVSEFVATFVREHYGVTPAVLPVPVDLARFPRKSTPAEGPPVILGVGAFDDPRKGIAILVQAFVRVKDRVPDARLRLSGRFPERLQNEILGAVPERIRTDIEVLGVGRIEDLPDIYRSAHVTAIPTMWEAFGMVAVESWACGTPVVACDHGGLRELVTDPAIGVCFDPQTNGMQTANAEGLADALASGLTLGRSVDTVARCRAKSEGFGWDVLGGRYEKLLLDLVAKR